MPGYDTKQEHIAVAGVASLLIRSLLDRQQFADPFGDAEHLGISSAFWPLFGLPWPSGAELAERLGAHPVTPGERILEIGCGLGLASLVGHRRGADVTASDCHPLAGAFLAANLLLNDLLPMKYRHGQWGLQPTPQVRAGEPAVRCLEGEFDLIIGSDVLYERDDGGTLAHYISRHAAPTAEVWIVDPNRGNRAGFHRHMAGLGFEMREVRIERSAHLAVAAYRGRHLTYRRTACCDA